MNAPAVEATMPASSDQHDLAQWAARLLEPLRRELIQDEELPRPSVPAPAREAAPPAAVSTFGSAHGLNPQQLEARLIAAQQRVAELEARLVLAEQARDRAVDRAAQLDDRNRELASDLDNALDELAGHATHAEQERLVHRPVWSPWAASASREGYER